MSAPIDEATPVVGDDGPAVLPGGPPAPAGAPAPRADDARAAGMLVLACALWGASFTWVKAGLSGMAAARGGKAADFLWVPALYIGWRFILGAALWGIVFRRSLKGWTRRTARRSVLLGALLFVPMFLQLLGLGRTSESVSAFLTSLTIVFTPLTLWLLFRERPSGRVALGVLFGMGGVYLMSFAGSREAAPGKLAGVALGVACALGFSLHIVGIDRWGRDEDPFRLTLGQFATVGVLGLVAAPLFGAGWDDLAPGAQWAMLSHEGVARDLVLAVVFSTLGAFGLMFRYQPRVSASRATIIYLTEPIFASLYAWVFAASGMTAFGVAGGALILAANFVSRRRADLAPPDAPSPD
ncbi:MAG: DMT family transporter [Planctomycetota bacterium]